MIDIVEPAWKNDAWYHDQWVAFYRSRGKVRKKLVLAFLPFTSVVMLVVLLPAEDQSRHIWIGPIVAILGVIAWVYSGI